MTNINMINFLKKGRIRFIGRTFCSLLKHIFSSFGYHLSFNFRFANFFDRILAYICCIFSVLTNCTAGSSSNNVTDFRNSTETSLVINDINSKIISPKLEFPRGL